MIIAGRSLEDWQLEGNLGEVFRMGHNAYWGTTGSAWQVGYHYGSESDPTDIVAAAATTISSNSSEEAVAGNGGRTVRVRGVDGSFNATDETVTFTGTTGVTLSDQLQAVNDVRIITSGRHNSYNRANAGIVSVGHGTLTAGVPASGAKLATIAAYMGRSTQTWFTCPLDKVCLVGDFYHIWSGQATQTNQVFIRTRDLGVADSCWQVERPLITAGHSGNPSDDRAGPFLLTEKQQIQVCGYSSADAQGGAGFTVLMMDESEYERRFKSQNDTFHL